jgi:hypothetical protein
MTLPSTAAAPVNPTLHEDFADISPSSLFVRPRPVWTGSHYPPRKCINHERVFLLETNAVIAQQQCE